VRSLHHGILPNLDGVQPLIDHRGERGGARCLTASVHADFPPDRGERGPRRAASYAGGRMSPTWIWMQVAIIVFVLIGMIVAITKLA
jgi:hypothetical protein